MEIQAAKNVTEEKIWKALAEVPDPEIPPLSVVDLGIITKVEIIDNEDVRITMTPTFSGCPAINYMKENILQKLNEYFPGAKIDVLVDYETQWNSNRISEKGREILKNFGLAPPKKYTGEFNPEDMVQARCPYCDSENTTMHSSFGPTLCRSVHYCFDCLQSFEQFKPL